MRDVGGRPTLLPPARDATQQDPGLAAEARAVRPGPARALAATYALFALAAGSRAAVQLAVQPGEAPFAYGLSAVAAVLYLAGTVALRREGPRAWRIVLAVCAIELTGVLVVGTLSLTDPGAFPDASVWSGYGAGYGHVPLLLPLLGLFWLSRPASRTQRRQPAPTR